MARSEARIFTSIWRDEDFTALPPGAQRLYMFLLSQDDLSYCGVIPLRERRWASKAAGMSVTEIEQDLKALVAAPIMFAVPDWDTGELLIRSLMRRDGVWKQPNLLKQAREAAESVESAKIRGAMLGELRRLPLQETGSDLVKTLVADFITDLEQGTGHPTDYPPPNASDDPTGKRPDNPSDDASAEDYARARGLGECDVAVLGSPEPLFPGAPKSSLPAQSRKNATRLPDSFLLDAEMVTWAAANSPHVDPQREFDRFRDYWLAKAGRDGRKLDWLATWRNWMRTAEDRQRPRERIDRRQEATDEWTQQALDRAAAKENR